MPGAWSSFAATNRAILVLAARRGILLIGLIVLGCRENPAPRESWDDLIESIGQHRVLEARLTGGFSYGSWEEASPVGERREVLRSAHRVRVTIEKDGSPQARHLRGILNLVLGDLKNAIPLLEEARAQRPQASDIHADLAAAYLARALRQDQAMDLLRALDAAETAVQLDPRSAEALYNRALARQKIGLQQTAVEAWSQSLKVDADSEWSHEGRAHVRHLERPREDELWPAARQEMLSAFEQGQPDAAHNIVGRYPQESRLFGQEVLLANWIAVLQSGGTQEAVAILESAKEVARALADANGETLLLESITAIESANPRELRDLVRGHAAFAAGLHHFDQREFEEASVSFRQAEAALRRGNSPFRGWSRFMVLRCAYHLSDYEAVTRLARSLLEDPTYERSRSLLGRTSWVLGTTQFVLGRTVEAQNSYQHALEHFLAIGEKNHTVAMRVMLANTYDELGDPESAWRLRYEALEVLEATGSQLRRRHLLTDAAFSAIELSAPAAALPLLAEVAVLAQQDGNPYALTSSHRHRAAVLGHLGDLEEAQLVLRLGKEHIARIPNQQDRLRAMGEVLFEEGRLRLQIDPSSALAPLDEAVEIFRENRFQLLLPRLVHERAKARLTSGEMSAAESDFLAAIEELERQRGNVASARYRVTFLDRFTAIFEDMIRFQVDQGQNPPRALEFAERSRSRLLLDWIREYPPAGTLEELELRTAVEPQSLARLTADLRDEDVIVEYEVLPDRLLIWIVTRGSTELEQVTVSAARLEDLVLGLRRQLLLGKLDHTAETLYRLLIRPLAPHLTPGQDLVLIPDEVLYSLPFSALMNENTGEYFLEERAFISAPSLSFYVDLLRTSRTEESIEPKSTKVLLVTDPAFSRDLFPALPDLPGAEAEGRELAKLFPEATILSGRQATTQAFMEGLEQHQIFHFAGHALFDRASPLRSRLALAPTEDGSDPGILYARDLLARKFGHPRMAVLSACQTVGAGNSPNEGVAGLVWPLLAGGTPFVVASLLDVDDRRAMELTRHFYTALAHGERPLVALRAAQLRTLNESRQESVQVFDWAAFQAYGMARW